MRLRALAMVAALAGTAHAAPRTVKAASEAAAPAEAKSDEIAKYYQTLEAMKLIDAESGTLETLKRELRVAEELLHDGAFSNAAVRSVSTLPAAGTSSSRNARPKRRSSSSLMRAAQSFALFG